jgi:hypothetical protein
MPMDKLWPDSARFQQIARSPSRHAPEAVEVLTPLANDQPTDVLVRAGARDVVRVDDRVIALSVTGRSFLAHGEALLAEHPLEEVRLVACRFLVDELAVCPNWTRLRRVSLRGNQLGMERLRTLLNQGRLRHLEAIDLRDNGLSVDDADVLHRAFPLASAANSIRL